MTCPHCGEADQHDRYCANCGRLLNSPPAGTPPAASLDPSAAPTLAPEPAKPGCRRWLRRIALWGAAILATLFVLLLIVSSAPSMATLVPAVVLSTVPAIGYAYLVLRLDRNEAEPVRAVAAAFAWGAIGAVAVAVLLEMVLAIPINSLFLETTLVAPLVEETTKGIALLVILLLYRHELDNVLDGIVYGALIGIGFAMTENILYLASAYHSDGVFALTTLFVLRAVIGGFGHAAYTAMTGAAIGWAREQHGKGVARFVVPVLGWMLAVILHAAWNGGATFLGDAIGEADPAVNLLAVFLLAVIVVLPTAGLILAISRSVGRREIAILRDTLLPEVAAGTLTPEEYLVLGRADLRPQALLGAELRGGRRYRTFQQRFFQVAADLAFHHYHLSRGEAPKPGQQQNPAVYRAELARLRSELEVGAPGWPS